MSRRHLEEQARRHYLFTAEQLLQQTNLSSHNEVVVLANKEGKKVRLAEFFYKTTEDGTSIDEGLFNTMRQHAQRLNLSLIPITEPPYAENKIITRTDELFSVQYGGKVYILQGKPEWRFRAYGQTAYSLSASPDEMEQVFNYLHENNISEEEVKQLRLEYAEIDKTRQQPKVSYDEHGNITLIEKRTGYGTGEMRTTVGKVGYARKVNVIEENKKFPEMMADPSRPQMIEPYDRDLASPIEAGQVALEAIENSSEGERGKLEQWWQEVKENVTKHWEQNQRNRG